MISGNDFKGIWEALNSSDWQLIQEMEAIIKDLAQYALGGSQTDSSLPSEILIYRKVSMGVLQRQSFHLLLLHRHDQGTTLADLEQTRKNDGTKKELIDLSANEKICLERIKGQIRSRFVDAEEPKTYIPLFLDPLTVPYVNHIIPEALKEGTLRLFTEMVTNVLNVMNVQNNRVMIWATALVEHHMIQEHQTTTLVELQVILGQKAALTLRMTLC